MAANDPSSNSHPNPRSVSFRNGHIDIAGDLRLPDGFDARRTYPALVVVTPGSSVKEQIGAVYGGKMAGRGFVTLTFDPSYQGESGGEPRDMEDPAARVEDIRLGRAIREAAGDAVAETLETVGKQRTAEARGGEARRDPWIPDTPEQAAAAGLDRDTLEAVDYYRTPCGFSENSTNRLLFRSSALLLGFDAFHLVEELLTQPVQVIVGGRRGTTRSFDDGQQLWQRVRNKKDLLVIDGAGHYDMYDKPQYVDQAVERFEGFYKEFLWQ